MDQARMAEKWIPAQDQGDGSNSASSDGCLPGTQAYCHPTFQFLREYQESRFCVMSTSFSIFKLNPVVHRLQPQIRHQAPVYKCCSTLTLHQQIWSVPALLPNPERPSLLLPGLCPPFSHPSPKCPSSKDLSSSPSSISPTGLSTLNLQSILYLACVTNDTYFLICIFYAWRVCKPREERHHSLYFGASLVLCRHNRYKINVFILIAFWFR